jgi:2,4-dienoyl-CoA reductase-like NADH-dependent reductase (Old Yellow Enzyme family)
MSRPSRLFSSYRMRGLDLANRLVVSPMCQYSADDGTATDWHMMHAGSLTNSGAGLFIVEATAVEREGRITHGCLGLYSDENERALNRVVAGARRYGTAKIGIQLAHAGRKASCKRPWEGKTLSDPLVADPWPTKSASALAIGPGWHTPSAMTLDDIAALKQMYVTATERAQRIGFDMIEIHAAHGYLINQFLSPISNKRTDRYGGSLENRMRLALEVFETIRRAWPEPKPIGVRISAIEWIEGGWSIEDSVVLARALKALGCDYIDCSSGGIDPAAKITVGPGYQVPFAARVRKEADIPTMAVGLITDPDQAEAILDEGQADLIAVARAFLDDPHWGWHAAYKLEAEVELPPQYRRSGLKAWDPARRHGARR